MSSAAPRWAEIASISSIAACSLAPGVISGAQPFWR
jgi:hypothetical protein